MTEDEARALVASQRVWHQSFDIFPGVRTPGSYDPGFMVDLLQLPKDMSGLRVLDVGASDGFFSRELDKRGADVTAIDYRQKTVSGFAVMEKLYGREIKHINANIYDLPAGLGLFDVILCLGVIYHLPDMPRALWTLRELCSGRLFVESYIEDFGVDRPLARYCEADSLSGDSSNFWAPNIQCIHAIMRDCALPVERSVAWGDRVLLVGRPQISSGKMELAYGRMLATP